MSLPHESEGSRPRSFVEAVCFVQPYYILLVGLLPGFALIFGSLILHISNLKASAPRFAAIDREVGYLPALNWSLTYAILLPLALYLMTNVISGLADALDRLHSRGMVLTEDTMSQVRDPVLTSDWLTGSLGRKRLLMIFAVGIPATYGLVEWFLYNLLRLVHLPSPVPSYPDYDWGLAGIMPLAGQHQWPIAPRLANALFDLLAFTTEIILIASLIAFFIAVLDLGRVVPSGRRGDSLLLVPDLDSKSTDRRLGFEVFADPLEKLFGVALVAYLICYLVRLEGAYMASSSSQSLAGFVTGDILKGARQAALEPSRENLISAFVQLFNLGDQQVRGVLASMMSVLVATFSLATVVITVRGAALSARLNALRGLEDGTLKLAGQEQEAVAKKLDDMVIWPFGYLRLDALIFWVIVAVGTLVLYRIGLFMAGVVAFSLFVRLMKRLLQPGRSGPAPPGPS